MSGNREVYSAAISAADRYRWESKWPEASQEYQRALAEFPEDATARSGLGFCFMQTRQWQKALQEYLSVLQREPGNVIALSKTAELYGLLNRRDDAYQAYLLLADLYAQAGQGARAEAAWQKAVQLSPGNPEPHERLAQYYFEKKDISAVIQQRLAAAQTYLIRNELEAARIHCEEVLRADGSNVQAQQLLARILQGPASTSGVGLSTSSGGAPGASLPSASGSSPSGPVANSVIGTSGNTSGGNTGIMGNMGSAGNFNGVGNPGTSSTMTGGAMHATPRKRITASQVTGVLRQAQTFQTQGRFTDAIDLCEQILESGFDRPDARYFLGWLYQEQQRWDEAIRQFQMLLNDPDYALSCYYALGQCYRARGDLRTATVHFDEAVDRVNLDALTVEESDQLVQLCQEAAEAHRLLGEQEQALTVYNALLGFLRSRGWNDKVAQVEFMLQQLQNAPMPNHPVTPAVSGPQAQQMPPTAQPHMPPAQPGMPSMGMQSVSDAPTMAFNANALGNTAQPAQQSHGPSGELPDWLTGILSEDDKTQIAQPPSQPLAPPPPAQPPVQQPAQPSATQVVQPPQQAAAQASSPSWLVDGAPQAPAPQQPAVPSGPLQQQAVPSGYEPTVKAPPPPPVQPQAQAPVAPPPAAPVQPQQPIAPPPPEVQPAQHTDAAYQVPEVQQAQQIPPAYAAPPTPATSPAAAVPPPPAIPASPSGPLAEQTYVPAPVPQVPPTPAQPVGVESLLNQMAGKPDTDLQHVAEAVVASTATLPEQIRLQVVRSMQDIQKYINHGLLNSATEECLRVIDMAPQYLDVHQVLCEIYVRQGKIEQAVTKYAILVDTYVVNGRVEDAIAMYRRILQLEPNNLTYRMRLINLLSTQGNKEDLLRERTMAAESYLRLGYMDRALTELEQALQESPTSVPTRLNYALALQKLGRVQQAVAEYQRVLQVDPRNLTALIRWHIAMITTIGTPRSTALEVLTRIRWQLRGEGQKLADAVLREYNQALDIYPNNADVQFSLAQIYHQCGLFDRALDAYTLAMRDSSIEILVHVSEAQSLLAQGKPEAAIQQYEQALQLVRRSPSAVDYATWAARPREEGEEHQAPEVEISTLLARAYGRIGRQDQMENILRQVKQSKPGRDEVSSMIAEISSRQVDTRAALQEYGELVQHYRSNRQADNAIRVLNEMVRMAPQDSHAHAELADIYIQRGLLDEGIAELRLLSDIYLRHNDTQNAGEVFQKIGNLNDEMGNPEEAFANLSRAADLHPSSMEILRDAVGLCMRTGRSQEAGRYQNAIARHYFETQQVKESVAALQQLIAIDRSNFDAYDMLGQTYQSVGEYEQASRVYRNLAKVNPGSSIARERLAALQELRMR